MREVVMRLSIPFMAKQPPFDGRKLIEGRDTQKIHDYVMALALELKANAGEFSDCEIKAIRLDGGSASIIGGSDLEHLLRLIRAEYHVAEGAPVSLCTCPADINGANMPFFNRAHITRYDLEFYSLESQDFIHLHTLNYIDQLPYISNGFLRAEQRGNMGAVLIYGKKTISRWGFRRSILEITRRPFRHLILQRCQGEDCLEDSASEAQLEQANTLLEEHGFRRYLPNAWCIPGNEDQVLISEKENNDILAFGLASQTIFDKVLSTNTSDYELYIKHSRQFELITADVQNCE